MTVEEQSINDLTHALEEAHQMILMQGVTISSLQSRIFTLEMEIVDQMSANATAPPIPEAT